MAASTFNSSQHDVFGNMSDDDDDDLNFNLDGSGFGGEDDEPAPIQQSSATRQSSSVSDGLFDDDIPASSDDGDPYADPNDIFSQTADEDDGEDAEPPAPKPAARHRGRPRKQEQTVPTRNPTSQQDDDYDAFADADDADMQSMNAAPSPAPVPSQPVGYAQPDPNAYDPNQYASPDYYQQYAQQVPQGNDGMQSYDYSQQYAQIPQQTPQNGGYMPQQGYGQYAPQQAGYDPNQAYYDYNAVSQQAPVQDNPFMQDPQQSPMQQPVDGNAQTWGQQSTQVPQPEPVQQAMQPQYGTSQQFASTRTAVGNDAGNANTSGSSSATAWSGSVPKPDMIARIISVADAIRNDLSPEERDAVKTVMGTQSISGDEIADIAYSVLTARKSTMTALGELLSAKSKDIASRVFYLLRLNDEDLQTIYNIGIAFGAKQDPADGTANDHYAISEQANQAVSTLDEGSVNLLQAVYEIYNKSKALMNG